MNSRLKSFVCAFQGLLVLLKTQANARIHMVATFVVILAGFYFNISKMEWLVLFLTVSSVIVMEAVNTSIEFLANAVTREQNKNIKNCKDVAAGAVLIAAIFSIIIGLVIFIPYLAK
jgi:diacylglycerol kinase